VIVWWMIWAALPSGIFVIYFAVGRTARRFVNDES
jgi:hypothetical protein